MSFINKEGTAVLGLLTMLAGDVIYSAEWRDEFLRKSVAPSLCDIMMMSRLSL
jgi:hypothetical protein